MTVNRSQPSLKDSLQALATAQPELADKQIPALVTVLGADELLSIQLNEPKSAQEQFFFSVQWTRESLRQFQFPLVLWLTPAIATDLAQQAPDFWSWRGGTFEFSQPIAQDVAIQLAAGKDIPQVADRDGIQTTLNPTGLEKQITELTAQQPDSPLLASLYNSLGQAYEKAIRYDKAEIAYHQALKLIKQLNPEHISVTDGLKNLARLYCYQGRYGEAEPLYKQALAMQQQLLGNENLDVASSLNSLASLYKAVGGYNLAEPLYKQALAIRQRLLGKKHVDLANSLNNLAELYRFQGRYSEAEPLYKQALAMRQELLGDEHPHVATSINNLALLYLFQCRYDEAEELSREALKLWEKLLGNKHFSVATRFNNLGSLRFRQGRYAEAARYLAQTLPNIERLLGIDHPQTKSLRANLEFIQQHL
ncbi:MAG: tetratricopeptide repeat protein [Leptolyngbyaceae cyanobacterium]